MNRMTPSRTRVALHTMQPPSRLPQDASESLREGATGDNRVAPAVFTAVGNTRALVQVPHRSMQPGQSTEGLQQTGKPASTLRGSAWSIHIVRPHGASPLERSDI